MFCGIAYLRRNSKQLVCAQSLISVFQQYLVLSCVMLRKGQKLSTKITVRATNNGDVSPNLGVSGTPPTNIS